MPTPTTRKPHLTPLNSLWISTHRKRLPTRHAPAFAVFLPLCLSWCVAGCDPLHALSLASTSFIFPRSPAQPVSVLTPRPHAHLLTPRTWHFPPRPPPTRPKQSRSGSLRSLPPSLRFGPRGQKNKVPPVGCVWPGGALPAVAGRAEKQSWRKVSLLVLGPKHKRYVAQVPLRGGSVQHNACFRTQARGPVPPNPRGGIHAAGKALASMLAGRAPSSIPSRSTRPPAGVPSRPLACGLLRPTIFATSRNRAPPSPMPPGTSLLAANRPHNPPQDRSAVKAPWGVVSASLARSCSSCPGFILSALDNAPRRDLEVSWWSFRTRFFWSCKRHAIRANHRNRTLRSPRRHRRVARTWRCVLSQVGSPGEPEHSRSKHR